MRLTTLGLFVFSLLLLASHSLEARKNRHMIYYAQPMHARMPFVPDPIQEANARVKNRCYCGNHTFNGVTYCMAFVYKNGARPTPEVRSGVSCTDLFCKNNFSSTLLGESCRGVWAVWKEDNISVPSTPVNTVLQNKPVQRVGQNTSLQNQGISTPVQNPSAQAQTQARPMQAPLIKREKVEIPEPPSSLPEEMQKQVAQLKSLDFAERREAIEKLSKFVSRYNASKENSVHGDYIARTIVPLLGDNHQNVRDSALNALKNIDEAAITALGNGINDSRDEVRAKSYEVLYNLCWDRLQWNSEMDCGKIHSSLKNGLSDTYKLNSLMAGLALSHSKKLESREKQQVAHELSKHLGLYKDALPAITYLGKDAVPALFTALVSPNEQTSLQAAEALKKITYKNYDHKSFFEVAPALLQAIKSDNTKLKIRAMDIYARSGYYGVYFNKLVLSEQEKQTLRKIDTEIVRNLYHPNKEVRAWAIEASDGQNIAQAAPKLISMLSLDPQLSTSAGLALIDIVPTKAKELKMILTPQDYNNLRWVIHHKAPGHAENVAAIRALAVQGEQAPQSDFDLLQNKYHQYIRTIESERNIWRSGEPNEKYAARAALENMGMMGQRAAPTLIRILDDQKTSMDLRSAALEGLRNIKGLSEQGVAALARAYKSDDSSLSNSAHYALVAQQNNPAAAPVFADLIGYYYHGEEPFMNALKEIGKPALPALLEKWNQNIENFRRASVVRSMGEIDPTDSRVFPKLLEALKWDDLAIQNAAAYSLGNSSHFTGSQIREAFAALKTAKAKAPERIKDPPYRTTPSLENSLNYNLDAALKKFEKAQSP